MSDRSSISTSIKSTKEYNMKTIFAAVFLIAMTGCSSMGMSGSSSAGTSGRSDMQMGKTESRGNNSVIDQSGNLTQYHGG
jgi:hypothetical protein